jgi:O-antigen/teichoic acid export membrane protein
LLICTSISTATFSIAVQELEHRGRDAGRIQAGKNGAVLLALALPACIGLALTAPQIAAVMVGPQFRTGVAALIPIMCFTALFRGVRGHFLDHAFHLAGRSDLMLLSYAPAAAADVVINLFVVPRYGMFGAAWTALGCQGLAVVTGWVIGRRVFPIWLPARQVFKILAAVVPMAGILGLIDFSRDWGGLLAAVGLGAAVYAASAVLLDVGGIRPMARARLLGRRIRRARPRLRARSARWRLPVHPPRS